MENVKEKYLKKLYYNAENPASFSSYDKLYQEAKHEFPNIKIAEIKKWLNKQLVYSLHKDARKKFKRNPMIAEKPYENFQADLIDMQQFSAANNGNKYILTVIDIFSKRANVAILKNKSAQNVCNAFEKIFQYFKPLKLQTDNGKEFTNKCFKNLMKKYSIIHFTTKNKEIKCAIVERFNKTLKNKMFKLFTSKGNNEYIEEINDLIESYNNTYHSSIKMKPNDVSEDNSHIVFKNLYGFKNKRELLRNLKNPKHKKGDKVRLKYEKKIMDRGYYPNWTDSLYDIYKSVKGLYKPQYIIELDKGKYKRLYPEEIQKTEINLFRIEKVLKQKTLKGKKYFYVKWLNYPTSQNSWIEANDLTNISPR